MAEKLNFTKKSIQDLEPRADGKRKEVWDTKVNGLVVYVTRNSVKTFYFRKRARGEQPEHIRIGRFPDVTPEIARLEANKYAGDFARGDNPVKKQKELTLEQLHYKYINYPGNKIVRPDAIQYIYDKYFPNSWKNIGISSLEYAEIDDWHKSMPEVIVERNKGSKRKNITGHRTANRALDHLSTLFEKALCKKWFSGENPAKGIERFDEASRNRFMLKHELPLFFKSLLEEPSETMRDYFLIQILAGSRKAKTQSMAWPDISFEAAEWRVPKQGREKNVAIVPLVDDALFILEHRKKKAASIYVFPSKDSKSGHIENTHQAWERIIKRTGLKNLIPHDIRRTFASWQLKTGASLRIIGASLGQKSIQATAIYAHADIDPIRESVERATSAILNAAGLKEGEVILMPKKKEA